MKKFITFIASLCFVLMPLTSVKGLVIDKYEKNIDIKNLYNEKNKNVITVSNNNKTYYLTNDDIHLMAQVVYGESRGEPYNGKVAVASVILNRLCSSKFPNTIKKVISQNNAFSCVKNGKINAEPDKISYNAVMDALKGNDPTNNALYFYNPKISTCTWMKNISKKNLITIGNHIFFRVN